MENVGYKISSLRKRPPYQFRLCNEIDHYIAIEPREQCYEFLDEEDKHRFWNIVGDSTYDNLRYPGRW